MQHFVSLDALQREFLVLLKSVCVFETERNHPGVASHSPKNCWSKTVKASLLGVWWWTGAASKRFAFPASLSGCVSKTPPRSRASLCASSTRRCATAAATAWRRLASTKCSTSTFSMRTSRRRLAPCAPCGLAASSPAASATPPI